MDPFQFLPPEIRLEMLLSFDTYQQVSTLSRSSPAIYALWSQHFELIACTFVVRAIPDLDDLLQDYMALILFPVDDKAVYMPRQARIKAVETHLCQWGKGKLPDPVKLRKTQVILDLPNLHYQLQLYIEDFLGKATHDCIRRSYRALPKWAHVDFSQDFSNQSLEQDGLDCSYDVSTQLTSDQRRCIFRSFLRHELICKIYSPQKGDSLVTPVRPQALGPHTMCTCELDGKPETHHDLICDTIVMKWPSDWFDPADPFRRWDWNVLELYEGTPTSLGDRRLFTTIREYIRNMYIALIQNEVPVRIPTRPEIMPHVYLEDWSCVIIPYYFRSWVTLKPPDINPERFFNMGGNNKKLFRHRVNLAVSTGLDVLTAILRGGRDEFHSFIRSLGEEMILAEPALDHVNIINPLNARCQECWNGWIHDNEVARLKKQTAWPLFNSPPDPELVDRTWMYGEAEEYNYRPEDFCSHGSACGMAQTEEIYHAGGFAVYPSLSSMMVPFWKYVE